MILRVFASVVCLGFLAALPVRAVAAAESAPATDTAVERGPAPAWVQPLAWTVPTDPAPAGAPAEVILSDAQDQLTPDGSDFYFHLVVRLLNAEGVRQNAEQTVTYEPSYEKITWHALRVHRGGTTTDRLAAASFKRLQREPGLEEQLYTGTVTAAAVLEDIRVGDIVEIEYTYHTANPVLKGHMSARHYVGSTYPMRRQVVLVRTPESEPEPAWSFFVPPGTQNLPRAIFQHGGLRAALERPLIRRKDDDLEAPADPPSDLPTAPGQRIYRWKAENLPPITFDPNIPPSAAPYFPLIRCDNFRSWSDVVDWAEPLFREAIGTLPDEMKRLAAQWKREHPDRGEQLALAVHWVQDEVRYFAFAMGEHNLRPRPLPAVCTGRFGDCKDKSVLLSALLREMGFEAWPALVNSYWRDRVQEHGPGAFAFNHVIVAYEFEGRLRWLDATLKNQLGTPGNWAIPSYRLALILRPNEAELQPVRGPDSAEPDTTVTDVFTFDEKTGDGFLDTRLELRGLEADLYRQRTENQTAEDVSSRWYNFIGRFYRRLEELTPPTVQPAQDPAHILITARYRIPEMIQEASGESTVAFYAYAFRAQFDAPQSRRRRWPYALPADRYIRHRIEATLPFELALEQQPQVISSDGFECRIEKGVAGRHFSAVHDMRVTADYVPAARMEPFSDAADEILTAISTALHRRTAPAAVTATTPASP